MSELSKEKLVKIIKSNQWMVQGFNGLPVYLHTVASYTGWMIKPIAGVNYSHFFLRMNENRAKYYYDEKDLAAIGYGYYKKIKNISQLKRFIILHKKDYLTATRLAGKIPERLNRLSLMELVNLAQKTSRELSMAIGITHSIEGISFVSEHKIKDILNKRGLNNHKNFQLLSAPIKMSFLSRAQTALWKIKQADENNRQKLIKAFLRDFGWIDNSYVRGKNLSAADVLKKAAVQRHLPSKDQPQKTRAAKLKFIKSMGLTKEEQFAVQTVETCTNWQDDRKKFVMQTMGWLEPIIEELAKRVQMPLDNFKYIYAKEITYKNLTSKKFLNQIAGRYPKTDSYALKNKIFTYSGADAAYIEKKLIKSDNDGITELKGMVACEGIVRGRIKICRSINDIPKLKKGEILVASMTRPEFLPAMQKAAGFITDEGGITSHAAIVAREMGKPCIIGTKIATEVLKDGDIVEVDANKGIVKKL